VEQEWPVFDLEGYWEFGALCDGSLELAMGDIAPGTGLWGGDAKSQGDRQDANEDMRWGGVGVWLTHKVGDDNEFDNALGHLCGV
jgi:hypothetical protein